MAFGTGKPGDRNSATGVTVATGVRLVGAETWAYLLPWHFTKYTIPPVFVKPVGLG